MYGHPKNPDPWSEVQEIPPYVESEPEPSGFVAACLMVVAPAGALAFLLGYLSGVYGWLA